MGSAPVDRSLGFSKTQGSEDPGILGATCTEMVGCFLQKSTPPSGQPLWGAQKRKKIEALRAKERKEKSE